MPPMRHCHHCKLDPHLTPTSKGLWTDEMNKDAKAACDIHIPTKDVSNFLKKKHEIDCSAAQLLKMKWESLAKNDLKVKANSADQLQHLMDNRQSQCVLDLSSQCTSLAITTNCVITFFFADTFFVVNTMF